MSADDERPTVSDRPAGRGGPPGRRRVAPRYEVGDEIARGGMGRVVEANDTRLERVVAVKEALTSDPDTLRRFARETRITARLEHPSIVPVYDASGDGETPFYVMRRVSGRPLAELIDDAPALAPRLALLPHLLAAAQAVAHAHGRGIVHRDLKPQNILVGELGETVVIDWGLAKVVGEDDPDDPLEPAGDAGDSLQTRAGEVFGTPGFMSPGQLRGEAVGPRGDVYALGASLYNLLAGTPPHHARTSDEIMARAAAGPPAPIAEAVPGVPRELATIVDKALAFADADRYRDAGELAEDLRRFLAGQLVASHRYSRRERLARFVRRHRAVVAVAVLATLAIATVGALAIRSVVAERDRADAKAREAEAARAAERERADQLLLLRARTFVESNPTAAIAALAGLSPGSRRTAEAHAIANAAEMRGVAWALPGSAEFTKSLALDPAGDRLLQVTIDGELRVWDLVRRAERVRLARGFGAGALWIDRGRRVLVFGAGEPTVVLDPATGATAPSGWPVLEDAAASRDGRYLAGIDAQRELVVLEPGRGEVSRPWRGHRVIDFEVAGDGGWIAAADGDRLVVFDRDGHELARRDGDLGMLASSARHLAALESRGEGYQVVELELADGARWRELDLGPGPRRLVTSVRYRDEALAIGLGSGDVLLSVNGVVREWGTAPGGLFSVQLAGDDHTVIGSADGVIQLYDHFSKRTLALPHALRGARVAARRGAWRVAVAGAGAVLVFELARMVPRRLAVPASATAVFVDDDLVLAWDRRLDGLAWVEVATGKSTPLPWQPEHGVPVRIDVAPGRRALLWALVGAGESELTLLDPRVPRPRRIHRGRSQVAALVLPGGGVLYADGDRVYRWRERAPAREVARLARPIVAIATLGGTRFAAVDEAGTVLRGDLATGAREQLAADRPVDRAYVAPHAGGAVLIGWGARLMRWDPGAAAAVELARFDAEIARLVDGGRDVIVELDNRVLALVEPRPGGAVHRIASHTRPPVVSATGAGILVLSGDHHEVLDLASRTAWPTAITRATTRFQVSPSGAHLLAHDREGALWLWELPRGAGALHDRLATLTNARETADGTLVWPWQRP